MIISTITTLCIILFVIYSLIYSTYTNEHFAGALTQLYAKGPQDTYLYGNVDKYIYPYSYPPYQPFWNASTRSYYDYPLYGVYPYKYYPFRYYQSRYYPYYPIF